jgi:hypothetical protein
MGLTVNEICTIVCCVVITGGGILGFYVWVKVKFAEIDVKIANLKETAISDKKETREDFASVFLKIDKIYEFIIESKK